MKRTILVASAALLLVITSGCANGPIRQWIQGRGGLCNTCQPPVGQAANCGTNTAPLCDSGLCGTAPAQQTPMIQAPAGTPLYSDPGLTAPTFDPTTQYPDFGNAPIQGNIMGSGYAPATDPYSQNIVPSADLYGGSPAEGMVSPPSIGNW